MRTRRALALLLAGLAPGLAAAQSSPVIEAVRVGSAGGRLVVEVVASEPVSYLAVDTPEPFTVTLFLAHATFAFPAAARDFGEGSLRRVAGVVLDRPDGLLARLDFVFEHPASYRVQADGRRILLRAEAPGVPEIVVFGTPAPEPLEARIARAPAPAAPLAPRAPPGPPPAATPPRPATPPAPAPSGPAARLVRITPTEAGDDVQISLEADRTLVPRVFTLQDPPRLVLDFDNVVTTLTRFTLAVGGRVLERIRAGQFQTVPVPVARIVLDLRRLVPYRVEPHAHGAVIHLGTGP